MFEIVFLGVRAGWRGQGWRVLLPLASMVVVLSLLAAGFSGRQPVTVALDLGFTGLRVVVLVLVLLWVQELFSKDIERKTVYFILAYPVSRASYLCARFVAVALLSLLAVMVVGGGVWLSSGLTGEYQQVQQVDLRGGFLLVLFGVWVDALVVASFAMLVASFSVTPYLPLLLGLAFGVAARSLGPVLSYLLYGERADPLHATIFAPVLSYSHAWLPDLSRLDFRPVALYDLPIPWQGVWLAFLSSGLYVFFMLWLAVFIFDRRNFV